MAGVIAGGIASLIAGVCTGLGALPLLVHHGWSDRTRVLAVVLAHGLTPPP